MTASSLRTADLPSSHSQQSLWFLAQMEGASEAYHIALSLRLQGPLNAEALSWALDGLVKRHEALRTTFYAVGGEVFQRVGPEDIGFALTRFDLRGVEGASELLSAHIREENRASFDLKQGPLIRGRLIRTAEDEHVLLLTMHHIVSDGWSIRILTRELSALYRARLDGVQDPLPPLCFQYPDYAARQREVFSSGQLAEQADYWTRTLSGAPSVIRLPMDRRRPAKQDFSGDTVAVELDADLTRALKALSRRYGLTLFMTVLAGWALVLSRLSSQEEVLIGVPSANRNLAETQGLIGFFINTFALRIDLSGQPSVAELLERVKKRTLEAQVNLDIPFEQVVELVKPIRSLNHMPLFQVMFAWQNNDLETFDFPDLTVAKIPHNRPVAKVDLILDLRERDGRIIGNIFYATSLFDRVTIERYAGYLQNALSMIAASN